MALELVTVNTTEGAAFGAALLAGVGAGIWPDVPTSCKSVIRPVETTQPNPVAVKRYAEAYPIYQSLYPALRPVFNAVAI